MGLIFLPKRRKILIQCQGGQVRSVAFKFLLTYRYGHEALTCGWESNSPETRRMLYDWADTIIVVEGCYAGKVPEEYQDKMMVLEVGPDVYGNAFHPVLQEKVNQLIRSVAIFHERANAET